MIQRGYCEADHCQPATSVTPRSVIAHVLGGGLYGFGGRVRASSRLKIADAIIEALHAAGLDVVPRNHQ